MNEPNYCSWTLQSTNIINWTFSTMQHLPFLVVLYWKYMINKLKTYKKLWATSLSLIEVSRTLEISNYKCMVFVNLQLFAIYTRNSTWLWSKQYFSSLISRPYWSLNYYRTRETCTSWSSWVLEKIKMSSK